MKNILVISDIEGSSGCHDRESSRFLTAKWAKACEEMSRDVNAVVTALFDSGIETVTVQDFHRTAFNLLPELIDKRARIRHGYRAGKVYGIGDPGNAEAVVFLGLHAASGSNGFLPHTLTSRITRLQVNGRLLPEAELFAASLAPYNIRPIFFSGCPVACEQAALALQGIVTCPIDKTPDREFNADNWREGLTEAAKRSLTVRTAPYDPKGPFRAIVTIRDGVAAADKIARRWGFDRTEEKISIETKNMGDLYYQLIRLAYLTPLIERTMPLGLWLSNLQGWLGLKWARSRLASPLLLCS